MGCGVWADRWAILGAPKVIVGRLKHRGDDGVVGEAGVAEDDDRGLGGGDLGVGDVGGVGNGAGWGVGRIAEPDDGGAGEGVVGGYGAAAHEADVGGVGEAGGAGGLGMVAEGDSARGAAAD